MAGTMVQEAVAPSQDVLEAAGAFVDDVIAEAESQVAKQDSCSKKEEESAGGFSDILKRGNRLGTRWQNRARGFFNRILTHLKI